MQIPTKRCATPLIIVLAPNCQDLEWEKSIFKTLDPAMRPMVRDQFGKEIFWSEKAVSEVEQKTAELLNNYIQHPSITTKEGMEKFICSSHWGQRAGIVGAVYLALLADPDR